MQDDLARPYSPCPDLWVITTYYNPASFAVRRANYERFAAPLIAARIPLTTVECAFGTEPFELASSPSVIQVRGRDVMWMKERLLNLAIERLPAHVTKVAWVDADLLFTNPAWAQQTSALLEQWPIVQPFGHVAQMAKDAAAAPERASAGFAFQHQLYRRLLSSGHGAPGFAWAAQRDLVQRYGIYDAAIVGSGDLLWVHASTGRLDSPPVRVITGAPPKPRRIALSRSLVGRLDRLQQIRWWTDWRVRRIRAALPRTAAETPALAHYQAWAIGWYAAVRGRVGFAPGTALHLWHGDPANRQIGKRNESLRRDRFDPVADLHLNGEGVWEWASPKDGLHGDLAAYFPARQEDGDVVRA